MSAIITLKQYLIHAQRTSDVLDHELVLLIEMLAQSCSQLSQIISKGPLMPIMGETHIENIQGEVQKKLDILANDLLLKTNEWGGYLSAMASEEMETIYPISNTYPRGKYLLLFDPLDGSSNIDVNATIGTIFSVLKSHQQHTPIEEKDFLQPGKEQVAAGYVVYGPQTMLVLTYGQGVDCFTLDRDVGIWMLTQQNLTIPTDTQEFAINTSNTRHWHEPVSRYITELLNGEHGVRGKNFNMRWIASMVADVHRILHRGGIFMYPSDKRDPSKPGKLRLMYEANPMAMLIEQAGGAATNGEKRILDIVPTALHQRVPLFLGAKHEVERVTHYHAFAKS